MFGQLQQYARQPCGNKHINPKLPRTFNEFVHSGICKADCHGFKVSDRGLQNMFGLDHDLQHICGQPLRIYLLGDLDPRP